MKTIKYVNTLKVICPLCKKVIVEDKLGDQDNVHACKHIQLWFSTVSNRIVYAKRQHLSFLGCNYNKFNDVVEKSKMIVRKYISDCEIGVDTIAFQK
jgi:hypothetical protein